METRWVGGVSRQHSELPAKRKVHPYHSRYQILRIRGQASLQHPGCEANLYDLRFPVTGESGDFPAVDLEHKGEPCPHFNINPAFIPQAQN
jgi:hypothetical protein